MIPRDKLLHIGLGIIWLAAAFASFWVLKVFGIGAFLAYQTTTYALLYEVNQAVRNEGHPEFLDAVATASPGWAAWWILYLMER